MKIERIEVKKKIEEETSFIDPCKWDCVNQTLDLFPTENGKKKKNINGRQQRQLDSICVFLSYAMYAIKIIGDVNWSTVRSMLQIFLV